MSKLLASGMHLCSYNSGLQSLRLLQVEGIAQGQVLHRPEDALAAVAAAEVRRRAVEVGGLQGLRWRAAVGGGMLVWKPTSLRYAGNVQRGCGVLWEGSLLRPRFMKHGVIYAAPLLLGRFWP
jgi:hypothetical protein